MKLSNKGFVGILIVVIFILLSGVVAIYLYPKLSQKDHLQSSSPSVSPTPSTQLYQDPALGFQFKYPSSGYVVQKDTEEDFIKRSGTDSRKNFTGYVGYEPPQFLGGVILKDDKNKTTDQFSVPFTIWVFDNPKELDALTWYKRYWYYPFVWGEFAEPQRSQIKPVQVATISGQIANFAIVNYRPGNPKFIYFSTGNKMFLFQVISQPGSELDKTTLNSFATITNLLK